MTAQPIRLAPQPERLPSPPKHLGSLGRRVWRDTVREFSIDDPPSLELLRLACEALDRGDQAREIIATEGVTIEGRFGAKTHPAVAIERDSSLRAARLLRELGVTLDVPDQTRPPSRWRER